MTTVAAPSTLQLQAGGGSGGCIIIIGQLP